MIAKPQRMSGWKWLVCLLLLSATMLNYMDRQTLSQTAVEISNELSLNKQQYGNLEFGFGLAFAAGAVFTGYVVDRLSVRWVYPAVLVGWSAAGLATAYSQHVGGFISALLPPNLRPEWIADQSYLGLIVCRVALGFFEAGHWPCALVTSQRILSRDERTFGNSLLQSGASVGAILTPLIVQSLVTDAPGSWRSPFIIIGLFGLMWIVPWLLFVRAKDLALPAEGSPDAPRIDSAELPEHRGWAFVSRFLVLAVVVIAINLTWHYFRAWMPMFLREFHGYGRTTVNYFTSAYYIATDVGCICAGIAVRQLTLRGWGVHPARVVTFMCCAGLTALSTVAAQLPAGPLLLGLLLLIGFGALGLFPVYYSLTQELSARHQGKITGWLSAITWIFTAVMQKGVGASIDATQSYAGGLFVVGLLPLVALAALVLFWNVAEQRAVEPVLTAET